jgi:hypothetical protein
MILALVLSPIILILVYPWLIVLMPSRGAK